MQARRSALAITLLAGSVVGFVGCSVSVREPRLYPPDRDTLVALVERPRNPAGQQPFVKVHHKSGALDVLTAWRLTDSGFIEGAGIRYTASREGDPVKSTQLRVSLDSVALLETDHPRDAISLSNGMLNIWTLVWGATTFACVADPKSCFGSCPTFYVRGEDTDRPRAEGFSSSIARILEARDIDDLQLTRPAGATVDIEMRNEAWETHAVRWARLQAVARPHDADVAATTDGAFHAIREMRAPASCRAAAGDCAAAVAARDAAEWHDETDAEDLARPDTMVLTFEANGNSPALVLSARQSFVSTFVLYQTMAWLGHNAGDWLARLERGDPMTLAALATVDRHIGTVMVEQQLADGRWIVVARYDEAGPIAYDRRLVPLTASASVEPVRVRLIFAKGNWRVDQATLVAMGERLPVTLLEPEVARLTGPRGSRDVRPTLTDDRVQLTTFPGDVVALRYVMPREHERYALFLDTRGYYYEMMRGEWLAEGNAGMTSMLMRTPRMALQRMAPLYKARERSMEANFWASRFGRTP